LTLTVQQRLQRGVGLGQIQDLSQAAIAEIKRFDPDGVHDAVKLSARTESAISPATLLICGIQFGRLETLRFAFFEIAGQPVSVKSEVSRIAGHECSGDLYRRQGYCQSIRQIGQKPRPRTVRSL
jgi:hypothetical protein